MPTVNYKKSHIVDQFAKKTDNKKEKVEIAVKQKIEKAAEADVLQRQTTQTSSFHGYLQKSFVAGNLVKKQVSVKKKDGSVYTATRWIDPSKDKAHHFGGKYKSEDDITGNSDEEKINSVINSNANRAQKHRDLMSLGIYDSKTHGDLLGDYKYATHLQKQELREHDFSGFKEARAGGMALSSDIPTNEKGEVDIKSDDFDINDIKEEVSQKDYAKISKFQKKKIAEELGVNYKDRWDAYGLCLNAIMQTGRPKSLIGYGTGGVGKTWDMLKALDENNLRVYDEELHLDPDEYDVVKITGNTSPSDMYNIMYANKDKLVIFDDCDSMWGDPDAENMLKGALDTSGDGTIRYANPKPLSVTEEGKKIYPPKQFKFSGTVIFISNLKRTDLPQPIVNSRARAIDLSMTMEETLDKLNTIKDKMKFKDRLGNDMGVTKEHTQAVIDFLTKYKKNLDIEKVNGRTVSNLAMFAKVNEKQNGGKLDKAKFEKQAALLLDIA